MLFQSTELLFYGNATQITPESNLQFYPWNGKSQSYPYLTYVSAMIIWQNKLCMYISLHATGLYIDYMNNSLAKKEIMKKERKKVSETGYELKTSL